jgi:hypothetical protein
MALSLPVSTSSTSARSKLPVAEAARAFPWLTVSVGLQAVLLLIALAGLATDPRMLGGAPVWLKPFKFALSGSIYSATLAALLLPLRERRLARWVARIVSVVLVLEVVLISVQAARGVYSHYNVGTPLDAAIFSTMGTAITVLTVATAVAAVALARAPATDQLLRRAVVWGLALAVVGGLVGFLMTMPTPDQLAALQSGPPEILGAHTVGAPDGGPGLPLARWSATAGDLRVPHFWGLHAMQALPLLALWLRRRRAPSATQARQLRAGAVLYGGVFAVLLQQALRGQSVLAPDAWTLAGLGAVAALSVLSVLLPTRT